MTFLAVIQSKLECEPYRTKENFSAWILEQSQKALTTHVPGQPALLAFPELIGLPLYFFLERQTKAIKVQEAALEILQTTWREGLQMGWRRPAIANALLPRAIEVHNAMFIAFSQVARELNTYVVAGSNFLPFVDEEAAKGIHLCDPRVQNVSYFFAPNGRLRSRSAKMNLTKGLESSLGLHPARLEDWRPTQTKIGQIGTLVCYDAFFDSCIQKADAMGTTILVQPSANAAKWNGAWSADPKRIEGEEWLARGALNRIQESEHIQVVLNPMLVGRLFDLEFEGCSSIGFNGLHDTVFASSYNEFALVTGQLEDK